MKKLYLLFIIFNLIFFSCEENFDPYGEFKDVYALTLILRSDLNSQVATILKNYRPDGLNPYNYSEDPSVKGAEIRVWYNDSVYFFKDSAVTRTDTSRYNFPFSFYFNNNFKVANNMPVEVEVLLPNGKRLKSETRTPGEIIFSNESEVLIPPVDKNIITVVWNTIGEGTFYQPYMGIRYIVKENGVNVEKVKEIPVQYREVGEQLIPVYPAADNKTSVVYNMNAVLNALKEISSGDPEKHNYSVYKKLVLNIAGYDQHLSRYVSSTSSSLDDLTVSINPSDYTNVEGGYGIFGSYTKNSYTRLRFDETFITSLGYNFINEN